MKKGAFCMNSKNPIGVFDSGLGGISVLHTMHSLLPNENLIYLGDRSTILMEQRQKKKSLSDVLRFAMNL